MKKNFKHTNHSYLRYANCWEDADVLLLALNIQSTDAILSIASAGDNTFSILSKAPSKVVAIDVNEVQLYLVELKKVCFENLDYQQFLEFLGFESSTNRLDVFKKIKAKLSIKAKQYWELNINQISDGVIHQGKFENYFKLFRSKIIPLIHSKQKIDDLFKIKNESEQLFFFNSKWNTWRWRLLFKLFFSKPIMAKFGRDKSLFNEVKISVQDYIFERAKNEVSKTRCQTNYYLEYILKGYFKMALPHYARPENFNTIKANCHKLELKQGLIEEALSNSSSYNKFNLSNIFEYISNDNFKTLAKKLNQSAQQNSIFVNWSLMVPRQLSNIDKSFINLDSTELKQKDKVFFYNDLNVHTVL